MNTFLAAVEVIEASLDEQMDDWSADHIYHHWLSNQRTGVRLRTSGSGVELSGIDVRVPWRTRRRLRVAIERWAARNAVKKFKERGTKP